MRFISPKTDFAFKKIFGSTDSKDILISFLNALLYSGKSKIQDLEIIDPYSSGTAVGLKDTYLDVKAQLDTHEIVIIEMQVLSVSAFDKRVVYNAAKTYATQLKSGEGYFKLKPVIALTITDFIMFDRHDRIISKYRFKDLEDSIEYRTHELELVFVELPKFRKSLDQLEQLADQWIYFLKNAPDLDMIPESMRSVPELNKAMNIANRSNLAVRDLEDLEKREMFVYDQIGAILQGKFELISRQLNRKFGKPSTELLRDLESLSIEEIEGLSDAIFDLNSLEELAQWLRNKS